MTKSKADQLDAHERSLESIADEALDAFWHVIVQRYEDVTGKKAEPQNA